MTNPVFPTLSTGQDSSLYNMELEDPGMKTPIEGGYVVSRAKHTRIPRRIFKTGFTSITSTDRDTLVTFYGTVHGGSVIFDWADPASAGGATVYQVRFADKLNFKYTGHGTSQRWDVAISLEQA